MSQCGNKPFTQGRKQHLQQSSFLHWLFRDTMRKTTSSSAEKVTLFCGIAMSCLLFSESATPATACLRRDAGRCWSKTQSRETWTETHAENQHPSALLWLSLFPHTFFIPVWSMLPKAAHLETCSMGPRTCLQKLTINKVYTFSSTSTLLQATQLH